MTMEPTDDGAIARIGLRVIAEGVFDLHPHQFEDHVLRTTDPDGPVGLLFVVSDFAGIIGSNTSKAVAPLDADEKGFLVCATPGGPQRLIVVTEGGFNTLVMRSQGAVRPGTSQHRFRRWVTSDVLPSIRKTGEYRSPSADRDRDREIPPSDSVDGGTAEVLGAVRDLLRHHDVGGSLDIAMRLRHDSSQSVLKIHEMIDEWRKGQAEAKAGDDWKVEALRKARLDLAELTAGRLAIPDDQLVGVTVAGRMVAILFNRRAFAAFAEEHLQALAASTRRWTGIRLVVLLRGATAETRASWERWAALEPDVLIESEAEASRGTHASFAFVPLTFEGCDRSLPTEVPSGPSR